MTGNRSIVLLAGLCVLTLIVTTESFRYETSKSSALNEVRLEPARGSWRHSARGVEVLDDASGEFSLHALGANASSYLLRRLPELSNQQAVRVCAELQAQDLVMGEDDTLGGAFYVVSHDEGGRWMWFWPSKVARLAGTEAWHQRCLIVPVTDEVASMQLQLFVTAVSGQLMVRSLSLQSLVERPSFVLLRTVTIASWALAWVLAVRWLCKVRPLSALRILTVALASALLLVGVAPQPHLNDAIKSAWYGAQDLWFVTSQQVFESHQTTRTDADESQQADEADQRVDDDEAPRETKTEPSTASKSTPSASAACEPGSCERKYWKPEIALLDKWQHLVTFAVLAFVAVVAYRQLPTRGPLSALVVLAVCVQVLQSLTVTREPDVTDFFSDVIGIVVGVAMAAGWCRWRRIR